MDVSLELAMLSAVVLTDVQPLKTDAIFIHAQDDLRTELLECSAKLYHLVAPPTNIVINGLERYESTPNSWGCKEWTRMLSGPLRVNPEHILKTQMALHTGVEAEEFLKLCHERAWHNVTIAATPYRMPRCFLTVLGSMLYLNLMLSIHCITVNCDWYESVEKHSVIQGSVVGIRLDQLRVELNKIGQYRESYLSGDPKFSPIASPEDGLEYLRRRASV